MDHAQLVLQEKFIEFRKRNARFTLRAYARKLGISSGALSEILAGKRKLTSKSLDKISERLGLSPEESTRLSGAGSRRASKPLEYQRLEIDQFHLISDWWHFAILNLVQTKDFQTDKAWIARRLAVSEKIVGEAIERIFRLGLLQKSAQGKWRRTSERLQTSDDVTNLSIRRAHLQDLTLIEGALETLDTDRRDVSSITFAIDPTKLNVLKQRVREFQDQLLSEFANKNATEVFRFSSQAFPLTHGDQEND